MIPLVLWWHSTVGEDESRSWLNSKFDFGPDPSMAHLRKRLGNAGVDLSSQKANESFALVTLTISNSALV